MCAFSFSPFSFLYFQLNPPLPFVLYLFHTLFSSNSVLFIPSLVNFSHACLKHKQQSLKVFITSPTANITIFSCSFVRFFISVCSLHLFYFFPSLSLLCHIKHRKKYRESSFFQCFTFVFNSRKNIKRTLLADV